MTDINIYTLASTANIRFLKTPKQKKGKNMKTMHIIRQRCLAALTKASHAAVAAILAMAMTALADDEVPWIELSGTERLPSSESSGVFAGSAFDNLWISIKESNSINKFSSMKPTGILLIVF